MACFVVTTAEAAIVTMAKKSAAKNAAKAGKEEAAMHIDMSRKLKWLGNMLWGGSGLLAFEHVWHGEVTPYFPFLTAMNSAADTTEMLHEMSTVGVTMAMLITAAWAGMVLVTNAMEKKANKEESATV